MYRPSLSERLRFAIGLPLSLLYVPLMALTALAYALMPRRLFVALQDRNRAKEVAARLASLRPYVQAGDTVLDVGAGSGDFLKTIAQGLGAQIVGVDIIDYSDADVDVLMFDGHTIPLADNSADIAIAAFVLHHTTDQPRVLAEMARVSRRSIVIFEDAWFTPWQYLFVVWNDFYANIVMGSLKGIKQEGKLAMASMPMPLTFRRVADWERLFAAQGLELIETQVRHGKVKPMSKATFVLRVPGSLAGESPSA